MRSSLVGWQEHRGFKLNRSDKSDKFLLLNLNLFMAIGAVAAREDLIQKA